MAVRNSLAEKLFRRQARAQKREKGQCVVCGQFAGRTRGMPPNASKAASTVRDEKTGKILKHGVSGDKRLISTRVMPHQVLEEKAFAFMSAKSKWYWWRPVSTLMTPCAGTV